MEQKVFADKSRMRDSGIELLKVIAVILIVISHVVLTLITENEYIPYSDYLLDCTHATTNGTVLLLAVMRHLARWRTGSSSLLLHGFCWTAQKRPARK